MTSRSNSALENAIQEEVLKKLRVDIGLLNRDSPSEAVTAIVERIALAGLGPVTEERALKTLAAQTGDSYESLKKECTRVRRERRKQDADPSSEIAEVVAEFNAEYAIVNEGGKVWVMRWRHDPAMKRDVLERIAFSDFRKMYGNRLIGEDPAPSLYLEHPDRRQYLGGLTFLPGREAPEGYLNLWRSFAYEPKPGDWSLMQAHIRDVICCGVEKNYEYLLDWAAHAVQYPDRHAEVAVVMRGKKGTGKGIFGRWLCILFGQHGMQIFNSQHLVGRFNLHLRDCCLLFADEAFYAGDKQHESVLKGLITEPMLVIEGKGRDVVIAPNMLHVILAANAEWVVPASSDERRYFALEVSDGKRGDLAYFSAIEQQMRNGGAEAMLHDLLNRDISSFEIRRVPQTGALKTQKTLSLRGLGAWWKAVLERDQVYISKHGIDHFTDWQDFYSTRLLYRSYCQWCDEAKLHSRSTDVELGQFMSGIAQKARPHSRHAVGEVDRLDSELVRAGGGGALERYGILWKDRPSGYTVGTLVEARDAFLKQYDIETDWQEHDAADATPKAADAAPKAAKEATGAAATASRETRF